MLGRMDSERWAWLSAWAGADRAQDLAGADARAGRFRDRLAVLEAAAVLGPIARGDISHANRWPGWELSRRGLAEILVGIEEALGDWGNGDEGSPDLILLYAPARLAAVIEMRLGAWGGEDDRVARGLGELTAGAPIPSHCWLTGERETIARICLEIEEASGGAFGRMETARRLAASVGLGSGVGDW